MSYFDCYLIPIPTGKLEDYRRFSGRIASVYREYGALNVIDSVLDSDTADGSEFHAEGARSSLTQETLRDFPAAAAARRGETVVISWTEWASKAARDDALPRVLSDPRVQPVEGEEAVFEGARLVAGGFFELQERPR